MKKILLAASECVPFIKTGGLADVVGALPKYIDKNEYDVRVVIPKYLCIPEKYRNQMEYVTHFYTFFCGRNRYVGIMRMVLDGITFYFVDNEEYFAGPYPYSNPYYDTEKFSFFSKAVLSILPSIDFHPDIIHCNDWHVGLVPVYLRHEFSINPWYASIRSIITIHNLKFQGIWNIDDMMRITGFPGELLASGKLEAYGNSNMLKGALEYADIITTVSPTYTEEIKTPFFGEGLHGLFWERSKDFYGILNGIDYSEWNPATDSFIDTNFDITNFRELKAANKAALQRELKLPEDPDAMMIGVVSRLTEQKGFDLIARVFEEMLQDHVQFVILGTGDYTYEEMFRYFGSKFPEKVSANIYYSNELSHRIYASCDTFLMPSLFEPCGLSQIISLRYGTLPIVRETGGLKDTVEQYNAEANTGTGFTFQNYNAHEMMFKVREAEEVFKDKERWNQMIERAMNANFSWEASARKYEELYDMLIAKED
jgi:starch synthase